MRRDPSEPSNTPRRQVVICDFSDVNTILEKAASSLSREAQIRLTEIKNGLSMTSLDSLKGEV